MLRLALTLACIAAPAFAETPTLLELHFSAAARARIYPAETVTVALWYEGEPSPAGAALASQEMGLVWLGSEDYEVMARDQNIRVGGLLASLPLDLVTGAMATVNVYTARRAFEDNLLDCTLVSGTLAEFAGRSHRIDCKLIGE